MTNSVLAELDFIEELRLRRWARENYVPAEKRSPSWHPIIHDEMKSKELEEIDAIVLTASARSVN